MPAAVAGPGEVRDLVVLQAGRRQQVDRRLVHRQLLLLGHRPQLAPLPAAPERGALLVRQAIRRDVIDAGSDGRLQVGLPDGQRLARHGEDQIRWPATRTGRRHSSRARCSWLRR